VPGSNNGLGRSPEGDAEFDERNKANMTWLRQTFAHAKANNSRAVMVMRQANMFPEIPPFPGKAETPSGFTDLRALLEQEATAFQKPVVLVKGERDYFRVDNPCRTATPTMSVSILRAGRMRTPASGRRHDWKTSCASKPSERPIITGCM